VSKVFPVGIDVSARSLALALPEQPVHDFANSAAGHKAIVRLLRDSAPRGAAIRVCVEATGIYSLDLSLALNSARRVEVMVANPRAVSNFAKAMMTRGKSDPADAIVLLEFARRMPFIPWTPPSTAALQVRAAARRIDALVKALTAERNRLHATRSAKGAEAAFIREDIEDSIEHLEKRIARLVAGAAALAQSDQKLRSQYERLLTICGVAAKSAVRLLGELAVLPDDMTARQAVAHAGLDPQRRQSGTSLDSPTRISKRGNKRLRAALYMPALVAVQRDPAVTAYFEKLTGRGKKPMQAYVAVMRKMLHGIFGMAKHGTSYDSALLFPGFGSKTA
jgi:transposase